MAAVGLGRDDQEREGQGEVGGRRSEIGGTTGAQAQELACRIVMGDRGSRIDSRIDEAMGPASTLLWAWEVGARRCGMDEVASGSWKLGNWGPGMNGVQIGGQTGQTVTDWIGWTGWTGESLDPWWGPSSPPGSAFPTAPLVLHWAETVRRQPSHPCVLHRSPAFRLLASSVSNLFSSVLRLAQAAPAPAPPPLHEASYPSCPGTTPGTRRVNQ